MPIHAPTFLTDLKRWVTRFEDDLRDQCKEVPALDARLKEQYKLAKDAKRTAFAYTVWRDGELTQAAVGWVLSCVFVRFLEDNGLLERTYLSGVGENRDLAAETKIEWVRQTGKGQSDNDYLAHAIGEVGKLPGMADLMDARHNALWNAPISPDAAKAFIEFWRRIDPGTGKMAHEFTDPDWDTRFLGDLYQDLSESARKKFALLQTPDFVEEFILDRTLDPAIDQFGLKVVRMIDPTCGSGHFLLGAFRRLLARWEKERPDLSDKERAILALNGVYGVDINPFAVAIARFRLLLAAWRYCGVKRLRDAPDFKANLATGDSLLHGARFDAEGKPHTIARETLFDTGDAAFRDEMAHHFEVEDAKELHRILGQQYHAVVGNPPYITVKDKAVSELYRARFYSCSGKYSLSVPFMERFFDLALAGTSDGQQPAGFTGQITSNSFMKREFGKKLIEQFLPKWDLTHVLDTAGAYIPGHGTPTVILFGKNQPPVSSTIRTVFGIRGEPGTPEDSALGLVWQAIVRQIDTPGSESEWVSAADSSRANFERHPWSIGGGGASDVLDSLKSEEILATKISGIGMSTYSGADEVYLIPEPAFRRLYCANLCASSLAGDDIRDFSAISSVACLVPYETRNLIATGDLQARVREHFWVHRTILKNRLSFGRTHAERGMAWHEPSMFFFDRFESEQKICHAYVATHNHFVLLKGRFATNRHAPVINLPDDATVEDHLRILGLLNSAAACFWMKQLFHCKGSTVDAHGARQTTVPFEDFYEFDGTKLKQFPVVEMSDLTLVTAIQNGADALAANSPDKVLAAWEDSRSAGLSAWLSSAWLGTKAQRQFMIAWQEELDWQVYELYGLIDPEDQLAQHGRAAMDGIPPDGITLGGRAFEIRMARQMAAGDLESSWFERHKDAGSKPITELPAHWPADYRALVERRLAFIEENKNINLIERPEYKRRWNTEPWASRQQAALEKWLLTRLETYFYDADRMVVEDEESKGEGPKSKVEEGDAGAPSSAFSSDLGPSTSRPSTSSAAKLAHIRPLRARFAGGTEPRLVSVRQLAQTAQADSQWMEAATVFAGRADFEVAKLVETLVLAESVPALPADRYKATGLRKREEWEKTWELQRKEDAVEEEVKSLNVESRKSEEELKALIRKAQLERVGDIPVPPKYGSGDFQKSTYWKLRGKLDVPKERWVLYPGAEGGIDTSPVIAWAGWDHAQQAQALTGYYQQATESWGWEAPKLARLLAALKDLLPWLHQWHNALDPSFGDRPCDSFQSFYDTERHTLRLTDEEIEGIRMGG